MRGRGGSGSGPGPAVGAAGPMAPGRLPGPAIYGPGSKAPLGPSPGLEYTQCASSFGWERDTRRRLGSGSDQPQLRPDSEARRAAAGPGSETGARATETRWPASHPTRPSHPALLTAPPVRRAVGAAAAVRTGSRLTGNLNGGPAGPGRSWTSESQPGRPSTPRSRDFHHLHGNCRAPPHPQHVSR